MTNVENAINDLVVATIKDTVNLKIFENSAGELEQTCPVLRFELFGKKFVGVPFMTVQIKDSLHGGYIRTNSIQKLGMAKSALLYAAKENFIKSVKEMYVERKED